jgi:hypothetical protein
MKKVSQSSLYRHLEIRTYSIKKTAIKRAVHNLLLTHSLDDYYYVHEQQVDRVVSVKRELQCWPYI